MICGPSLSEFDPAAAIDKTCGTRKVSPSPKRYKYEKDAEDVYNTFDDESDQVWSSPSPIKDGSRSIPKLRDYSSKSSLLHRKHRPVMAPLTPSECRKQLNGNPRSGNTTPGKLRLQNSSGKINCRKSSPKACNGAKQSLDFYFSNSGSKNEGTNQNSDSPEFSEFGDEGNDKENIGTPCRKQRAVIAKIIDSLEEEEVDQLVEQSSCQDKLQNNGSDDVFDQLLKTSNSSFGEINSKKHGSDFRPWLSSSPSGNEEPTVRVQEPHEIGFPNPAGSNKCWMNATLQALLGLEPFIKELQCNFQHLGSSYSKKSNSAKVLSAFLDVVKSRQRGRQVAINTSLGTLSRSLGLLDAIFVSDCQQDAPEFLVRLLDCFREEFNQVRVSEKKLQDVDNFSLEDLQQAKENKDDLTKVHNPIKENFEFQLHETYSCIHENSQQRKVNSEDSQQRTVRTCNKDQYALRTNNKDQYALRTNNKEHCAGRTHNKEQCEERTTRHQDHLALFVDIPSRERGKCPSLQDALDHYMCPDLREMKCDKCGYTNSKVIPALHKLPRQVFNHLGPYGRSRKPGECSLRAVDYQLGRLEGALNHFSYFSEEDCGNITDTPLAVGFDEEDKELQCKLAFCKTIADECQPFLQRFQTSKPMTPYLFEAVEKLLRYLMNRCVKPDLMKCTGPKLLSIDTKKSENLILSKNIDIGFATKRLLGETAITVTERQKLEFIHECRSMLTTMIAKLQEKSPLKQKAVRGLSSLDPCVIQHSPQLAQKRFSFLLEELNHANIINDVLAENAKKEYLHFCNLKKSELQEIFRPCDQFSDEVGLDTIYGSFLIGEANYKHLWEVIKICLVLSHGNATVEGGFSVNKSLLVENMHEKTVIAQRHIHDEIQEAGGIKNIHISKKMLDYVRGARKRYHEYLEMKKQEKSEKDKKKAEKRKLDIQVKDLEGERKKLMMATEEKREAIEVELQELKKKQASLY
uniref:USP domain-containing protein n=1 Tax=Timema monikensis TaxID=170555 RepID=A0A7R9ECD3_9NEOP|nr:unnamed protein product [Timema monikensis]